MYVEFAKTDYSFFLYVFSRRKYEYLILLLLEHKQFVCILYYIYMYMCIYFCQNTQPICRGFLCTLHGKYC